MKRNGGETNLGFQVMFWVKEWFETPFYRCLTHVQKLQKKGLGTNIDTNGGTGNLTDICSLFAGY